MDCSPKMKGQSLKQLKLSLKYRPKIYRLILKLRETIRKKNRLIAAFHRKTVKEKKPTSQDSSSQTEDSKKKATSQDSSSQTENSQKGIEKQKSNDQGDIPDWNSTNGESEKSLAEQVKEVAQNALAETGMVYVESAGMYYDYKTGYYYNTNLGLYYHTETNCYYTYSEDKKTFVFHSYPDMSKTNQSLIQHEKKKAKKHKQDKEETSPHPEKKKKKKVKRSAKKELESDNKDDLENDKKKSEAGVDEEESVQKEGENVNKDAESDKKEEESGKKEGECDIKEVKSDKKEVISETNENGSGEKEPSSELEDGECTDGSSESSEEDCSTETDNDDDVVAKHHPPCMRIIVKETKLPKLKVGTLYLITKDGGTIGREGSHHSIILKEHNVSRDHLEIKYDMDRHAYVAIDLGSKNGSILNGNRMSSSQAISQPIQIPHGSTIQLGETKLLCHIHPGNDTCGHCEPGLVMAAEEKEKTVAYTRTCDLQKQHQLELARLKNKYAPQLLAIEDGNYNDRAKTRRETVGSSHNSEKTQQSDLETCIPSENKGFKLLEKMGWAKGEGLGKDNQGETEPIPLVSNESKAGLGAVGSAEPVKVGSIGSVQLQRRMIKKPLRPPAKLFRDPLEEDD